MKMLLAVLLNPPGSSSGTRTRNAVERAGQVLGYDHVKIANLCTAATPTVVELNDPDHQHGWSAAREELARSVREASGMLAGWGVAGLSGNARRACRDQVGWLCREAASAGIDRVWMVGGEARHPSRWHQYVSDRHGRTTGGSFEVRLTQVLQTAPVDSLVRG